MIGCPHYSDAGVTIFARKRKRRKLRSLRWNPRNHLRWKDKA